MTKVAVIVTGDPPPRWQVDALLQIGELSSVEITTVLAVPTPVPRSSVATILRDRWIRGQPRLEANQPTAMPDHLNRLVRTTNDPDAEVGRMNADVVICLAPDTCPSPKSGREIWKIVGNTEELGMDEVLDRSNVACLALVRHDDTVLMQACLSVTASTLSTNAERLLKAASSWPSRSLAGWTDGHRSGSGSVPGTLPKVRPAAGNPTVLRYLLKGLIRRSEQRNTPTIGEEWNIGVLYQPISSLLTDGNSVNVRWLPTPAEGSQRMQPFGYMDHEDRLTALYIKVDGRDGKWSIARVRPKGDNVLKRSRLLMDLRPGNGYPYVVPGKEGPLVVIGSHEDRATALYRFDQAGEALEPARVLLDRVLCSPTLFQHEGKWWLLGTCPDAPDAELLAFHADRPEGPFTSHRHNPLKLDLRSARPAGTPFVEGGQLYRPALDASVPLQPSIVIQCVDLLSTDRFVEHAFRRVPLYNGTAYPHGTRTICAMGDVTLVDGLRLSGNKTPQKPPSKRHRSSRKKRS